MIGSLGRADIVVDEIGLATGIVADFRLKTVYQPVFARRDRHLNPVAVEGSVAPFRAGKPIESGDFWSTVSADDLQSVQDLIEALVVRNRDNIGVDGLTLHLPVRQQGSSLRLDHDDAARIVRFVPRSIAGEDLGVLRADGFRIGIAGFGAGQWSADDLDAIRPELVALDSGWFQAVCKEPAAVQLLKGLVSLLQERSVAVHVSGIRHAGHLSAALDAGIDFLQGDHLAEPRLVGSLFAEEPIRIAEKLRRVSEIRRLFA